MYILYMLLIPTHTYILNLINTLAKIYFVGLFLNYSADYTKYPHFSLTKYISNALEILKKCLIEILSVSHQ